MRKKGASWKRVVLTILAVVFGVILALMIGATIFLNAMLNKIQRVDKVLPTLSLSEIESIENETDPDLPEDYEELDPNDVTMPSEDAELIENEDHIINILLIGQDNFGGIRSRSDSMILCTVNTEEKTLLMTSFLRDMYIDIPDYNGKSYQDNRLNTCYMYGGSGLLCEALKQNFGVQVDHTIEVDFSRFASIVNVMGGVGIELTAAEANHLEDGLVPGYNVLNGSQALAYARIRALDSDFGRTNRQRKVINALLDKARDMDLNQKKGLIDTVFPLVSTDMTNAEIITYAITFFPILKDLQVTSQAIPAQGTYRSAYVRGMAVLLPDYEANRKILQDTLK